MRYSTKQVKDPGIFSVFVGGVWGMRHNFWQIWRGVRANLPFLRGGYCVIFLLGKIIPPPPPPNLVIIAQSLSLKNFCHLRLSSTKRWKLKYVFLTEKCCRFRKIL